jgi:Kef-type K+ transport system membrane component KefB
LAPANRPLITNERRIGKMYKSRIAFVYAAVFAASVGLFLVIRFFGRSLVAPESAAPLSSGSGTAPHADFALTQVLVALIVIIVVARLLGAGFRWMHQPEVIGEMIAGILLGPSLLGHVAPGLSVRLFPVTVLPFLSVIAQIGVILYMFLVGVELDTKLLQRRLATCMAISQASIVMPFLLGSALALWLYPVLSTRSVPFTEFALFIGVALSITAFPVLARILTDRNMQKSRIGAIALACSAADDVTAWCLLAFVVGVARAKPGQTFITFGLTAAFIALIFFMVRPAFEWFAGRNTSGAQASHDTIVIVGIALLAAVATERIGIHALFGAFLIGVIVPHDSLLAHDVRKKLEDSVVLLLLPVFFAFTGLRTEIGLVNGVQNWLICILVIAVASIGKFGGGFTAARLAGFDSRQAATLGILMNTRGLMELIVLNVGLDFGVLSPTLFTMLVLMAIVTTVSTTPVLQAVSRHTEAEPLEQ